MDINNNLTKVLIWLSCLFYAVSLSASDNFCAKNQLGNAEVAIAKHKSGDQHSGQERILATKNDTINIQTGESLLQLATEYVELDSLVKAAFYLDHYIKQTHHIDILDDTPFKQFRTREPFERLVSKFEPKFNFPFPVYAYIALIGIFIAVVLNLKKSKDRLANFFISLFILLSSLFVLQECLYFTNLIYVYPYTLYFTASFNFLYGPLLLFYFKRLSGENRLKKTDFLHLVPFFICLVYFSQYYFVPTDEKLHILLNRGENLDPVIHVAIVLKAVSLVAYNLYIFRSYVRSRNKAESRNVIDLWKRNIILLFSLFVLSQLLFSMLIIDLAPNNILIHFQLVTISAIVLFVGHSAYVQPAVFNYDFEYRKMQIPRYQSSLIDEKISLDLKDRLLKLLNEEKIYKRPDLSLDILAEELGSNRHSTSQVINEHFNMGYFKLINKYRIEEAVDILKHRKDPHLKIIDIVYDLGYNNKVTFNRAFKEFTGSTPSQFLKFPAN